MIGTFSGIIVQGKLDKLVPRLLTDWEREYFSITSPDSTTPCQNLT